MDENPASQGNTPDRKKLEKLEKEMGELEKRAGEELKEQSERRTQQASVQPPPSSMPKASQPPSLPNIPPEPKPQWPSEEKAAKSKKVMLVAAVLLLISVVGAGAYYFGVLRPRTVATPIETPSPEPAQTADPTVDWETYKNSAKGFQFKYPPGYTYNEISDLGPYDTRVVFEDKNNEIDHFSVSTSPAELPDFPNDQPPTGQYSLDGQTGIYQELTSATTFSFPEEKPETDILIKFSEFLYQLKFSGVNNIQNGQIQQILATFEFLEVSPSPSPTTSPTASPSGTPVSGFGV